jgi:transcriptional regulator with XRE-family HTH domain
MKTKREPNDVAIIVAENLRKVREFQGLNQTQIAEQINTSQPGYCLSEIGSRELNYSNLYSLAVEFGVDLNFLFGLSDERFNPIARVKHEENLGLMQRRLTRSGKGSKIT